MWITVTGKKCPKTHKSEIVWKENAGMNVLRLGTNHPLSQAHHSFLLFLSFSSSLAPSEGQQQLYVGDKRVQRWVLGSDWLAQLLRWCEDYRLRLSKGHSAHGCHLVTSLPQMTVGLATLMEQSLRFKSFFHLCFCLKPPFTFKTQSQTGCWAYF